MPGPAGFDATRMFQLADKAGELTEDMWEACGEPTTLKNARRAYKKYYEAKERHELDNRLEEELRPTPEEAEGGRAQAGGQVERRRQQQQEAQGARVGGGKLVGRARGRGVDADTRPQDQPPARARARVSRGAQLLSRPCRRLLRDGHLSQQLPPQPPPSQHTAAAAAAAAAAVATVALSLHADDDDQELLG